MAKQAIIPQISTFLFAGLLALTCSSICSAPVSLAQDAEMAQVGEGQPVDHIVLGQEFEARLSEFETHSPWDLSRHAEELGDTPVFFGSPTRYPLPLSHRPVLVTLVKLGSFKIRIVSSTGQAVDSFQFEDIGIGVYLFQVKPAVKPGQRFKVQLFVGGELVDEGMI